MGIALKSHCAYSLYHGHKYDWSSSGWCHYISERLYVQAERSVKALDYNINQENILKYWSFFELKRIYKGACLPVRRNLVTF
jgi:hypothetical protein